MAVSDGSELSENLCIRITKQDKELLERICRARGEDPSDFVRRAVRKEFAILCYLPEEEKKVGASESGGGIWRCAAAERPKEAKADFQKSKSRQDSSDRPNPLRELSSQCP